MEASAHSSRPQPSRVPATVRTGVTGHRKLANEGVVREAVRSVLAQLDKILSHTPHMFVVVSPLAEGADRLVASEVLAWPMAKETGKPDLEVVLPLPEADYLQDFETQESKGEFKALVARARSVQTLGPAPSRPAAYDQVGHYVVDNCDVLIAIWDGKPPAGQGGTAEIVQYARQLGRSIFWIDPDSGKIVEEEHEDRLLESLKYLDAYNGEHVSDLEAGSKTEDQYRLLEKQAKKAKLEPELLEPLREHLLTHFVRADLLAGHYQGLHTKAGTAVYGLAAAAVATAAIQPLFFPHFPQMLWFEVAAMATVLFILAVSRMGGWHRKWIDYRFLAERLRAAMFLCVAGIECEGPKPPPYLSLSHRPNDWMVTTFASIWDTRPLAPPTRGIPFEPLRDFLLAGWIGDQVSYHTKTSQRHGRRHRRLALTGEGLFALTVVAAAIHATGLGDSLLVVFSSPPNALAFVAIMLPVTGAALAGIRVHREYLRNSERYSHMARHLSTLSDQIKQARDLQTLTALLEVANEVMLRENQDWRVVVLFHKLEAP